MAQQEPRVKCPLCDGRGELAPSNLIDQLASPELRKRLEKKIAAIAEEFGCVPAAAGKGFDFEKEVHNWNPALPIWRRSPKE